jgi:hypothetical protein
VITAQVASGPWLVYVIVDHGMGTTSTRPIAPPRLLAFDARTLRVRHVTRDVGCVGREPDPTSDPTAVAIRDIVVDRTGAAAWACTGPDALAAAEVHAADAEGAATIGLLGDASTPAPLITRRGAVVGWGPGGTDARRLRHVPRPAADRPCTFPVGSVEVAGSSAATLATTTVPGKPGTGHYEVLWSCPAARPRRPLVLFSGGDTDLERSTTLAGILLAGTRAIGLVDSAETHYGDGSIALRVFDVATGHAYDALSFDRQSGHRIDDYAVGAGGEVLWLTSWRYELTQHLVLATHAGGIREIAVAPAGQITDLALTAAAAGWRQDGVAQAVALR